ncbi:endonuclease MutS2 [Vagococcus carniphilus]|uniref:Endonuclease MutS2 n=1 Tax=Vagococcus carniphilus TaxID=218144 RepID=A0AAW8U7D9_9ENTE|nr:endonuclease MutS2 [Vagococcus carniphilus]MDT2831205.1 endonuclease MutS2 [Vagococcus carniphilus]MDT2834721.1 endonuclease MutS2 [Vagococcus carniphilus]MDT2839636.1 endonuclease MutS2 [Vagococcus carniphilus]MDT2848813.1 endonuclease MutS2 [Vagococcus carniphilus]MDT2854105.1 endonuclease MutS2 [Vagococcus carniphilus]
MNKKILQTLEFDKVKQMLSSHIVTKLGEEHLQQLAPLTDYDKIEEYLIETEDAVKVLRLRGGIPIPVLENIKPHMKRIEIGAMLNGLELAQVGRVLRTVTELQQFFEDLREAEIELERLYEWSDKMVALPELAKVIRISVDEDGHVTDEASSELKGIRQSIRRAEQGVREQLDSILRGGNSKYLSDTIVTMRNDRYVIPVKSEYRSHFGGVVHDQSASGQTVFVEPRQVVELNNKLRQHQIAERKEIERILAELSNELEPFRQDILQNAFVLGKLDFINSKAVFGKTIKGIVPALSKEKHVSLKQARHPLIAPEKVVANDIILGEDYQAIVITGPNTGGKTITLKTLGLLQLMGQAGLPIPAHEDSVIGVFSEVYADIGDEQSIEQNLSTFSSHMTNIVDILKHLDKDSLVLFDELGAGTDPQEGAALAISILDQVGQIGAFVMATTHYPELKVYGYNRSGTINASMEFDVDTLSPTYHLLIGIPGRSNAFDISKRLGLSSSIIEQSKQIIDGESQDLNEMISDLENQRKMTETEYLEMRHYVDESESLHHDLKEAYELFFEEREKELNKAKAKANEIIEEAQAKAEGIISDIRQMQLRSSSSSNVKEHELIDVKTQLSDLKHEETHLAKNKVLQKAKVKKTFKVGDDVMVETFGQRGTLINKVGNKEWQVQLGILKMNVSEDNMTLLAPEKEPVRRMTSVRSDSGGSRSSVKTQLDLRGKRFEEAVAEVDQYIDAALLAGYPQVTIVHGRGTGALKKGVQDYLKNNRRVKKYEYAPPNQGGDGATIVSF